MFTQEQVGVEFIGFQRIRRRSGNDGWFVWITDVLPNELADFIEPMMAQGAAVLKTTLEEAINV